MTGIGQILREGISKKTTQKEGLQAHIQDLNSQLAEAATELRAVEAALEVYLDMQSRIPPEELIKEDIALLQPNGFPYKALHALRKIGRPADITKIVEVAGDTNDPRAKRSYQSQINAYARDSKIFTQSARGMYGLKEWDFSDGDPGGEPDEMEVAPSRPPVQSPNYTPQQFITAPSMDDHDPEPEYDRGPDFDEEDARAAEEAYFRDQAEREAEAAAYYEQQETNPSGYVPPQSR